MVREETVEYSTLPVSERTMKDAKNRANRDAPGVILHLIVENPSLSNSADEPYTTPLKEPPYSQTSYQGTHLDLYD